MYWSYAKIWTFGEFCILDSAWQYDPLNVQNLRGEDLDQKVIWVEVAVEAKGYNCSDDETIKSSKKGGNKH